MQWRKPTRVSAGPASTRAQVIHHPRGVAAGLQCDRSEEPVASVIPLTPEALAQRRALGPFNRWGVVSSEFVLGKSLASVHPSATAGWRALGDSRLV